jgi:hypothetical protein
LVHLIVLVTDTLLVFADTLDTKNLVGFGEKAGIELIVGNDEPENDADDDGE